MSCCGKKREAIRQSRTIYATPAPAPTVQHQPLAPVVFKGSGAYLVTGPHTRAVYQFSQQQPEQWIDAKDAAALIQTRFFQAGN
ncbi:MAG: hypothetical protein ABSF70_03420 [Terracidiphilus sp.]|jgi:hypothetical protein